MKKIVLLLLVMVLISATPAQAVLIKNVKAIQKKKAVKEKKVVLKEDPAGMTPSEFRASYKRLLELVEAMLGE